LAASLKITTGDKLTLWMSCFIFVTDSHHIVFTTFGSLAKSAYFSEYSFCGYGRHLSLFLLVVSTCRCSASVGLSAMLWGICGIKMVCGKWSGYY